MCVGAQIDFRSTARAHGLSKNTRAHRASGRCRVLYCAPAPVAAAGPPRPVAAAVQKLFDLNVESMAELMSELVTVEGAAL